MSEEAPRATSLRSSFMTESADALRQYMLPYLDLKAVLQLAGTCRSWRHVIIHTPLDSLSDSAQQAVLPSRLMSQKPLPEVLKQQAQLLARLRGKNSAAPRIQRLSINDARPDSSKQGSAQQEQSTCKPKLHFRRLLWSPCASLEDAGRWIALNPHWGVRHVPIIVDMETSAPVCFSAEDSASIVTYHASGKEHELEACWLDGNRLLFSELVGNSERPVQATEICGADANTGRSFELGLLRPGQPAMASFLRRCIKESSSKHTLSWITDPDAGQCRNDQKLFYNLPGRCPLYELKCPNQLLSSFLHFHSGSGSAGLPMEWRMHISKALVSPDGESLAIVWEFWLTHDAGQPSWPEPNSTSMGLSIYSAISGEHQHSISLIAEFGPSDGACWPTWLPCSSRLVFQNSAGHVFCVTSAAALLWSSHQSERDPGDFLSDNLGGQDGYKCTTFCASPCGCFILVVDKRECDYHYLPFIPGNIFFNLRPVEVSVVEASTGHILHRITERTTFASSPATWSQSGQACLLRDLRYVLAAGRCGRTFHRFELEAKRWDRHGSHEWHLSLSPCGRIVIGRPAAAITECPALLKWQIPPASVTASAAASFVGKQAGATSLEPAACACLTLQGRLISWPPAWHPWHAACMCALTDVHGGIHLIDVLANRCVVSLSRFELYGPALQQHVALVSTSPWSENTYGIRHTDHLEVDPSVLSWCEDGSRLAAACLSQCSVLHF